MAFKFLPKERRIPTLIGITVLVLGIGAAAYLTQTVQRFFLKAEPTIAPQDVKISNVFSDGFTISWLTAGTPATGYVIYGQGSSLEERGPDIRDQGIESLGQETIHYVEIKNLRPETTYYFKIGSQGKTYDNDGSPYKVVTAPVISSSPASNPAYGLVFTGDEKYPGKGIVFLTVGKSATLSTLITSSGNWL